MTSVVRAAVALGLATFAAIAALVVGNLLLRRVLDVRPPGGLWGSVVLAITLATVGFWIVFRRGNRAVVLSLLAAVALVVGFPLTWAATRPGERPVPDRELVPGFDIVFVVAGSRAGDDAHDLPPSLVEPGWINRYSVGIPLGQGLKWLLVDSESRDATLAAAVGGGAPRIGEPSRRPGAELIVVIVPDPVPPVFLEPSRRRGVPGSSGEIVRWRAFLETRALAGASTFALLDSRDQGRVRAWKRALEPTGGTASSIQALGEQSLVEAALTLSSRSPASRSDIALALRYRPRLLFDSGERLSVPVDVDSLFSSGQVRLCRDSGGCAMINDAGELINGGRHLRVGIGRKDTVTDPSGSAQDGPPNLPPNVPPPGFPPGASTPVDVGVAPTSLPLPPVSMPPTPPPGQDGKLYIHVVRDDARGVVALDYWWYLPFNPTPVLSSTFCGPGFSIPALTCFDHESDWEGVTVILATEPETGNLAPVVVHYAQHEHVTRYLWSLLTAQWARRGWHPGTRPLVFLARGSHASYPMPCARNCSQVGSLVRREGHHDGGRPWAANRDTRCSGACVIPIPTANGGTTSASWNSFNGPWGERRCILHDSYCDTGSAPTAPSFQGRYECPWQFDRLGPGAYSPAPLPNLCRQGSRL